MLAHMASLKIWVVYQNNKRKKRKTKGTAIIRVIDDAEKKKRLDRKRKGREDKFMETMKVNVFRGRSLDGSVRRPAHAEESKAFVRVVATRLARKPSRPHQARPEYSCGCARLQALDVAAAY